MHYAKTKYYLLHTISYVSFGVVSLNPKSSSVQPFEIIQNCVGFEAITALHKPWVSIVNTMISTLNLTEQQYFKHGLSFFGGGGSSLVVTTYEVNSSNIY